MQAADEFAPRLSRSQPDLRPSWPMAHPTGSTRGFGDLLSSSSPLGLNSSAREELERVKKRRGGRGTGAEEFSQKMKRRACGQATTLAKIMWDTLAECKASTIDHLTWKQTFFGPSSTFPRRVVQYCIGEEEGANIPGIRQKRQSVPHISARIVGVEDTSSPAPPRFGT